MFVSDVPLRICVSNLVSLYFHQPAGLSCHSSRSACYEQQQPAITGQRSLITISHSPLILVSHCVLPCGKHKHFLSPVRCAQLKACLYVSAPQAGQRAQGSLQSRVFSLEALTAILHPSSFIPVFPLFPASLRLRARMLLPFSSLMQEHSLFSRPFAALSSRPAYTCPHRRQGQGREESNARRALSFLDYLPVTIHHASRITHDPPLFTHHCSFLFPFPH